MATHVTIVWLRQNLRLSDNEALLAAANRGGPVIPVYVLDDEGDGLVRLGGASRWWLHGSLASLDETLQRLGSRLVLRRGRFAEVLLRLAADTGADAIHLSRGCEPAAIRAEQDLVERGAGQGVKIESFDDTTLFAPEAIRTRTGDPFRVFSPFWRCCLEMPSPRDPLPAPVEVRAPTRWPASDDLSTWALLPTRPDWAGGLRQMWVHGEAAARARLDAFLRRPVRTYPEMRDRPDIEGTSRLSPHLHFGEIGPRQCWHAAKALADRGDQQRGAASFLREVGWREFSMHLLHAFPHIVSQPFREEFTRFPFSRDKAANASALHAWQRGRTGYPIVDAGMRELWQTGWMHNRVRMIVASFLTKHLLIDWREGAMWFWDTLVDADLANNFASWQWVAGSGADAAPYFRIFNPVLQGEKFDPDGSYVRRYVPELARLPAGLIHAPWLATPMELAAAGVTLGSTYPRPLVDHAMARARALAAYAEVGQTQPSKTRGGRAA